MKLFLYCLVFSITVIVLGCGAPETANSNRPANTANRIQNINANELPPGLSASPVIQTNSVNAINTKTPGTTPTPGIPDPKTIGKPMKPGATPTPGIPDPATLKKQMEIIRRQTNSNSAPPPPPAGADDGQMMRRKRNITNVNN